MNSNFTKAPVPTAFWLVLFPLIYLGGAELGHFLSFPGDFSSFWPPSGIFLAALILSDTRRWPLLVAGAVAGNLLSDVLLHGKGIPVSLGFSAANAVEAVVGAVVLRNRLGTPFVVTRVRNVLWLVATTTLGSSMAGSLIGAGVVVWTFGGSYWSTWSLWWVSGVFGVLLITPAIVNFAGSRPWKEVGWGNRALEMLAAVAATAGLGGLVFGGQSAPVAFLTLPVLVWAAIRLRVCGAVLTTFVLALVALGCTARGYGPFAGGRPVAEQILLTQGFLGVGIVMSLLLAALKAEWDEAARIAEAARRELEISNAHRFRVLLDRLPQLAWTCWPDGYRDYLSAQWLAYTGIPEAEHLGHGWLEATHPDDRATLAERWETAIRTGDQFEMEFRLRSRANEYRWFKTRAVRYFQDDGREKWFGTNSDIHEQKQAEEELRLLNASLERRVEERTQALRESEERFHAIFDAQFQFIGLMTPTGELLEANRTALAAVGVTRDEVLGRPFWETAWWGHDSRQQDNLRNAVARAAAGEHVRFETSHLVPDGSLIWVDFSLTPFRDEHGTVVLLIPEGRDITERKRNEEALREQEERFRSAFEDAPIGMALVAPCGRLLRVNRSLGELLGYSKAELLTISYQALTHPDDLASDVEYQHQLVEGSLRTYQVEKRYLHKQGHPVHSLLAVSLVRDAAGQPLYFVAQVKDISQRKAAEAALAANDALLRQFIKHSPAAIAMFDRDVRYLQMSDRWLIDYRLSEQDIIGLSHYEVFPEVPEEWKAIHQRVLAGAVERCEEDPFPRADGHTEWLQWECRPWLKAGGEIGGLIMFTQVITQRKLAEEQIRASLHEKEVLLKEIHHRVKNNLQIVSALLDLQSAHTTEPAALAMFQETRSRVKSMALIHERLYRSHDMARVDFGSYLRQLADDLYHAYKVSHDEIELSLDIELPPVALDVAIPCGLLLNELISNCLKHAFTPGATGRIHVSFRRESEAMNLLMVSDTGMGFPAEIDFYHTSSFGLQLVNTLVEQLHGELELTSRAGTTVSVRFPGVGD